MRMHPSARLCNRLALVKVFALSGILSSRLGLVSGDGLTFSRLRIFFSFDLTRMLYVIDFFSYGSDAVGFVWILLFRFVFSFFFSFFFFFFFFALSAS